MKKTKNNWENVSSEEPIWRRDVEGGVVNDEIVQTKIRFLITLDGFHGVRKFGKTSTDLDFTRHQVPFFLGKSCYSSKSPGAFVFFFLFLRGRIKVDCGIIPPGVWVLPKTKQK